MYLCAMPRNKEFNIDEKLEVARNLFWEKGYHVTSLNDLEKALKINRSSLYQTFGNKYDLFIKCLLNYIDIKKEEYQTAASSKDPVSAIKNLIYDIMDKVLKDDKTCMVVNSTFELARIDSKVGSILTQQAMDSVMLIKNLFIKAQSIGQISPEKDPELLAYFIVTNFTAMWNTELLFNDPKKLKELSDFLIKAVCE